MTTKMKERVHPSTEVPRRSIIDMSFLSLVAIAVGIAIALLIISWIFQRI